MALTGAVGGGCTARGAEFLLAAARVNLQLVEALQWVMLRLEQGTPRQGWLIEEEEEVVAGEGEAFAYSLGGTLKLA